MCCGRGRTSQRSHSSSAGCGASSGVGGGTTLVLLLCPRECLQCTVLLPALPRVLRAGTLQALSTRCQQACAFYCCQRLLQQGLHPAIPAQRLPPPACPTPPRARPQRPPGGYNITTTHSMHAEVDHYRVHWWECGSCGHTIKRSMNRPPQEADCVRCGRGDDVKCGRLGGADRVTATFCSARSPAAAPVLLGNAIQTCIE